MKAKIISNLSGPGVPAAADSDYYEPHGTLQHVAHIPAPGVICQLKLGAAGLQYARAGVTTHVIPREELVALFEKLEPKFAERPNGNTRPREVDELGAPAAPGRGQAGTTQEMALAPQTRASDGSQESASNT